MMMIVVYHDFLIPRYAQNSMLKKDLSFRSRCATILLDPIFHTDGWYHDVNFVKIAMPFA